MATRSLAIRAEGLGKEYRIGELTGGYERLRNRILRRGARASDAESVIWALRDVAFTVDEGEVIGVVGGNGAGKSTLLKILARITEPSAGYVDIAGRVGSLLEVGTGFHPELTGRENVYLNGTILGMRRSEIRARFDEIVDFAGVVKFIDTPVKRYSSGMYVRLAFAVAAYLEPEILLVDEVLAVGDAEFQRRCLGRMGEVANMGRTVLFVSHNMQAVRTLCDRSILLESGRLVLDGSTEEIVRRYLSTAGDTGTGKRTWPDVASRPGNEHFRLIEVCVTDADGNQISSVQSSQSVRIVLEFDVEALHSALGIGFDLMTSDGTHVLRSFQSDSTGDGGDTEVHVGRNVFVCTIPAGLLNAGRYVVNVRVAEHLIRWIVHEDAAVQFDVVFDHGPSHYLSGHARPGGVAPMLPWVRRPAPAGVDRSER